MTIRIRKLLGLVAVAAGLVTVAWAGPAHGGGDGDDHKGKACTDVVDVHVTYVREPAPAPSPGDILFPPDPNRNGTLTLAATLAAPRCADATYTASVTTDDFEEQGSGFGLLKPAYNATTSSSPTGEGTSESPLVWEFQVVDDDESLCWWGLAHINGKHSDRFPNQSGSCFVDSTTSGGGGGRFY